MKHLIVALGLALVSNMALAETPAPAPTSAPTPAKATPPTDSAGTIVKRVQSDLNLTDEQVKKMREIRDQGGTRAEMQSVLTPEQRAKSAAMRTKHRNEGGDRRARMQEQLGLSDAQVSKLEQIRHRGGSRDEMRAVLTPAQQAKFDTLSSQHPRAKPAKNSAGKPVKNGAAKPAQNSGVNAAQSSAKTGAQAAGSNAAQTPAQSTSANPAPTATTPAAQ